MKPGAPADPRSAAPALRLRVAPSFRRLQHAQRLRWRGRRDRHRGDSNTLLGSGLESLLCGEKASNSAAAPGGPDPRLPANGPAIRGPAVNCAARDNTRRFFEHTVSLAGKAMEADLFFDVRMANLLLGRSSDEALDQPRTLPIPRVRAKMLEALWESSEPEGAKVFALIWTMAIAAWPPTTDRPQIPRCGCLDGQRRRPARQRQRA
jgi:hypothetical protein